MVTVPLVPQETAPPSGATAAGTAGGFDHREPGTGESVWAGSDLDSVPTADLTAFGALVVVAAHPDDESLGAGGLLHLAARAGLPTTVVVATDGQNSHPDSPTTAPGTLAPRRRLEVRAALDSVAPAAAVQLLGLPDGRVDASVGELAAVLDRLITPDTLVVAPWRGDRHPDHTAAGAAAALATERRMGTLWEYPIWAWHWATPGDAAFPLGSLRRVPLDSAARDGKIAALAAHVSQHEPLSPLPGDEPVLGAAFLEHFRRSDEYFMVSGDTPADSLGGEFFDEFYGANGPDPWGFTDRWYEARKRAVTLAALPRTRFRSAFEPGCSIGVLTEELASRCDRVLAMDIAPAALEQAQVRLAGSKGVRLARGAVPADWPDAQFDLVVLSEVGYYCSAAQLPILIDRAVQALTGDGVLLACHWRHPVAEYPISGDAVHRVLLRHPGLTRVVEHREDDFLLDVLVPTAAATRAAP